MGLIASQITNLTNVYSNVYSDADQRKHQSSASLAFVRGIHRGPVNSPHEWPVTRKMFPFDDVIMIISPIGGNYFSHWWQVKTDSGNGLVPLGYHSLTESMLSFDGARPRWDHTMMTSSNGNIFRVTGHLCGKFTGPRWISRTKASDAELWCFLWFTPE